MVFIVTNHCVRRDRAGSIWTKALVVLGPLALLSFLTVGSVVSAAARAVLRALSIDPTSPGAPRSGNSPSNHLRASLEGPRLRGVLVFGGAALTASRTRRAGWPRWPPATTATSNLALTVASPAGAGLHRLRHRAAARFPSRAADGGEYRARPLLHGAVAVSRSIWARSRPSFSAASIRCGSCWALSVCGLRCTALFAVKE